MADFKYVGQLSGATVGTVEITLTGTVEIGDLLTSARDKADATDVTVAWLAQGAGDDGDEITALPILPGTILSATADGDIAEKGQLCSLIIDTATQKIDADGGAGYKFFYNLDTIDVSAQTDDSVRVVYDPTYSNGVLALAGAN